MIDQTYCYVFSKIAREELEMNRGVVSENMDINVKEYDIIAGSIETASNATDDDDELNYALARSIPLPSFGREQVDIVSTSENMFPTLFHQKTETVTTDSLSELQKAASLTEEKLPVLDDGSVHNDDGKPEETVYRKVAEWVLAQRKYFRRVETEHTGDIEVIDPVDLFHDSLLDEYLLLTDSEGEKRKLLRELHVHPYNLESLNEARKYHDYEFVRTPQPNGTFELSHLTNDAEEIQQEDTTSSAQLSPFLGLSTVLEEYYILNRDGCEIPLDLDENQIITSEFGQENDTVREEDEEEPIGAGIRSPDATEIDMISSWFSGDVACGDTNADAITLTTMPTDVVEIATTVVGHGSESEDNDSDEVWTDAKDIPHWLDYDYEEQLFNQPHKPLYYYRDRIKGCYRIIGVEDETVVLFSENDDDSIFYSCGQIEKEATLRRPSLRKSTAQGILKIKDKQALRRQLFRQPNDKMASEADAEYKNDSGIEDMEGASVEETGDVHVSLSAAEAAKLGRVNFSSRSKGRSKSVSFQMDLKERSLFEFFLLISGVACVLLSLMTFLLSLIKDSESFRHDIMQLYAQWQEKVNDLLMYLRL